jgi:U3 small nucleolar ribonucleoprotein component
MKSNFEIRSAKLKKEIKKLENEAISGEKPWQMVGEVNAITRPENSLLQVSLLQTPFFLCNWW